ncbi:MAG: rhodanese-like domain-containing protein [Methylophilaceae bacterium]
MMKLFNLIKLAVGMFLTLLMVACSNDVPTVSPNQAAEMLNKQEAIMVDVREKDERNEQHIKDTLFIPLAQLDSRIGELAEYKNSPIILQCRSGKRSNIAATSLMKAGFTKVLNLDGGILAWDKHGLATVKSITSK